MKTILWLPAFLSWAAADPVARWEGFEKQVRDQALPKDSLKAAFRAVWAALPGPDTARVAGPRPDSPWVFPLAGYAVSSVGKGGFRPGIRYGGSPIRGYDFFDGNRHGGHPAYDIFIRDRNQDSRDDRGGKPVPVVAPMRLLVLSRETDWEPGSELRGGKYLWARSLQEDLLIYFSHLDSVIARPGDTLAAGSPLGTVGRTGRNAHAGRSPTHLHLMALRVRDGRITPFDFRPLLGR